MYLISFCRVLDQRSIAVRVDDKQILFLHDHYVNSILSECVLTSNEYLIKYLSDKHVREFRASERERNRDRLIDSLINRIRVR